MVRELFVWGKYVTYNNFREKTKIFKRNPRQVAGAPPPSPTPFFLPPLFIYVTQCLQYTISSPKNAEKIYAYMENTQTEKELRISQLIMVQHENFVRSLLSIQEGLYYGKKPFHATVRLRLMSYEHSRSRDALYNILTSNILTRQGFLLGWSRNYETS